MKTEIIDLKGCFSLDRNSSKEPLYPKEAAMLSIKISKFLKEDEEKILLKMKKGKHKIILPKKNKMKNHKMIQLQEWCSYASK